MSKGMKVKIYDEPVFKHRMGISFPECIANLSLGFNASHFNRYYIRL